MRVLICSDGTDPADKPARLGGLVGGEFEDRAQAFLE